jgi:hypothetical protein
VDNWCIIFRIVGDKKYPELTSNCLILAETCSHNSVFSAVVNSAIALASTIVKMQQEGQRGFRLAEGKPV